MTISFMMKIVTVLGLMIVVMGCICNYNLIRELSGAEEKRKPAIKKNIAIWVVLMAVGVIVMIGSIILQ